MFKEDTTKSLLRVQLSDRMREIIALMVVIVLGILLSTAQANAQEPKHRIYKAKKACTVLARKRNQTENIRVFAKKVKYKPMAEAEPPVAYRLTRRD